MSVTIHHRIRESHSPVCVFSHRGSQAPSCVLRIGSLLNYLKRDRRRPELNRSPVSTLSGQQQALGLIVVSGSLRGDINWWRSLRVSRIPRRLIPCPRIFSVTHGLSPFRSIALHTSENLHRCPSRVGGMNWSERTRVSPNALASIQIICKDFGHDSHVTPCGLSRFWTPLVQRRVPFDRLGV